MINGVVFDLDHTLFDRYATLTEIAPAMYEYFKNKIAYGLMIEDVAATLIYADKNFNCFGFGAVVEYLNESGFFREAVTTEEYTSKLLECFAEVAVPFPFTQTVLDKLYESGYKTGLITNGTHELQSAKLKLLGIENKFDEIIICGDIGTEKPDIAPFVMMSDKLGLPANELLYAGDHPVNDVDASRRAGYVPVWVKTSGLWQYPDVKRCGFEIDTVAEIFEVLNKLTVN